MAEVYYYVPNAAVENAVECGLKLSEWNDGEVKINGYDKKYLLALLNPRDSMELYNSSEHTCLKLEVDNKYCYVAESCLRKIAKKQPRLMEMYEKSIVPVDKYVFGMHRLPECLVVTTVIGGKIHALNKKRDTPVLFYKSEELYVNNIIEAFRDRVENFNDVLLHSFYELYAQENEISRITDHESGLSVFIDGKAGKTVILQIPEVKREWFAEKENG